MSLQFTFLKRISWRITVAVTDHNSDFHFLSAVVSQGSVLSPQCCFSTSSSSTSNIIHNIADDLTLRASIQYTSPPEIIQLDQCRKCVSNLYFRPCRVFWRIMSHRYFHRLCWG